MSVKETVREVVRSDAFVFEAVVPRGLQCCLLCGRTLTDRAAHDAIEERVLTAIRAEHPEWSSVDGACQPCIDSYRRLLRERTMRAEQMQLQEQSKWPLWLGKFFGRAPKAVAFITNDR